MGRNDVLRALEQRDAAAAAQAWTTLAERFPDDAALPALSTLVAYLERSDERPLANHDTLAAAGAELEGPIGDAARRAWDGDGAARWLSRNWCLLARRAAGLGFDSKRPEDHSAALRLRGGAWAEAEAAVRPIESWRRIPAPLSWMAEATCRQSRLDEAWPLLAELAWIAPERLGQLLDRVADPLLGRLRRGFAEHFDDRGAELAWFPAWVPIDKPALAPHLALAQPSQQAAPERAMRLVLEILGLERQGRHHDLVQRRRSLRDLNATLFAAYMATR